MRPILFAVAGALAGALAAHQVQAHSGEPNILVTAVVGAALGALGYYRGTIDKSGTVD